MSNAKKNTKVLETVATPKGTAKYAYLSEPDNSEYGKGKYKCYVLLEKGEERNDSFIKKIRDHHKASKGKADNCPVKDGDQIAEDNEKLEWARGKWVVKATSKKKPSLVNAGNKPLSGYTPRSGDLIKMGLSVAQFDTGANKGVTMWLNAVQLLERRAASGTDVFGDESDEYSDQDFGDDGDSGHGSDRGDDSNDDNGDY